MCIIKTVVVTVNKLKPFTHASGPLIGDSHLGAAVSGFFVFSHASVLRTLAMHPVLVAWKKRDAVSVMTPTAWRFVATTKTSSYTDYQRLAHDTGARQLEYDVQRVADLFLIGVNIMVNVCQWIGWLRATQNRTGRVSRGHPMVKK